MSIFSFTALDFHWSIWRGFKQAVIRRYKPLRLRGHASCLRRQKNTKYDNITAYLVQLPIRQFRKYVFRYAVHTIYKVHTINTILYKIHTIFMVPPPTPINFSNARIGSGCKHYNEDIL